MIGDLMVMLLNTMIFLMKLVPYAMVSKLTIYALEGILTLILVDIHIKQIH